MNIEYRLHIGMFHSFNNINEFNKVVVSIEYTYVGEAEIDGVTYSHSITKGANILALPEDIDKDNYITYDDITEEIAKQWVLDSISEIELDMMQKAIKHNIESQSKTTISSPPWIKITEGTPNPDQTIYEKEL
jgi:hypothetical protein